MEDTSFDDATDVQSIQYRLCPIDVGFDLREGSGIVIDLGDEPELRVSYPDESGASRVMAGSRGEVIARLTALGFEVAS